MDTHTPIEQVPYIGPIQAKKLQKLGIFTLRDLLYHLPFRYEDTSTLSTIQDIAKMDLPFYTIQGRISEIRNVYTRYGKKITEAIVEDDTGIADIIWFNQQYLTKTLAVGTEVRLSGKVSLDSYIRPKFVSPSYEVVKGNGTIHLGKLTGVYPETNGVTSKWLRTRIHDVLPKADLEEWLPEKLIREQELLPLKQAIYAVHFPKDLEQGMAGRHRIAFDEMLLIQLLMEQRRNIQRKETTNAIPFDQELLKTYLDSLPFALTKSQANAVQEILMDMDKKVPMNRLLQGDVGSGKTVVAGAAVFMTLMAGMKSIIMAPTSILAKQHYNTFVQILKRLGIEEERISLVTSKSKIHKEAMVYIGTQALLFQDDVLKDVALTIIDEQHRFGVHQREQLSNAKGDIIHTLTMTATPIPRTLALSIYGDLDFSTIDELPKGRKSIMTRIVPNNKRDDLYTFIGKNLDEGRQAFIICPLIDLSDKLNVKSAQQEFERLKKEVFPDRKLVLLHGQMKSQDKDNTLEAFKNKEYDILVSTPVVEVGIDIPNANIILIEGAERFGLAQLHQLRGRVGRGEYESYCFILTSEAGHEETERLRIFTQHSSGVALSEFDLKSRGPGEVYGVRQSGIPMLKAASLLDLNLITQTRAAASEILAEGLDRYVSIHKKLVEFKQEVSALN